MSASTAGRPGGAPRYEIRLKGRLDTRWSPWFDGLSVTSDSDGTTVLHGPVVDQAALHGVLQKVRDTGLPLLSVNELDADQLDGTTCPIRSADPEKEAT